MKITKAELIDLKPCTEGFKRFVKQTGGTELPVEISSLIGGMNTTRDLLWLAGEILPREVIIKFACNCALISLPLIEGYTDKYEVIAEFLKDPDLTSSAANAAADAANAAAYAANAATNATNATNAAANAAAYAANAAAYAATADAAADAYAAAADAADAYAAAADAADAYAAAATADTADAYAYAATADAAADAYAYAAAAAAADAAAADAGVIIEQYLKDLFTTPTQG